MTKKPDWSRFVRWLVFNVVFALLPLFSVWIFRLLLNKEAIERNNDYPETLFFAIMVCATALGDVHGRNNTQKYNLMYVCLEGGLLLGAIGLAIIYGGLKLGSVLNPPLNPQIETMNLITVLIIVLCIVAIVSEVVLTFADALDEETETEVTSE